MAKRALLVDDDPEFQTLATTYLVELGFTVVGVASVAAAQEAILARGTNEPFDLILCDVRMPEALGSDLIKLLQAEGGELPLFIFATAHSDLETVNDLIRNEADYIVVKPLNRAALEAALEKAIGAGKTANFKNHARRGLKPFDSSLTFPILTPVRE